MVLFNTSNYANVVSIKDLFTATNGITNAWFTILLFLLIFIIYFFVFKSFDTKAVLFAGSFTCSIISTLFFLSGIISISIVVACVIGMVGSIVFFLWRSDGAEA